MRSEMGVACDRRGAGLGSGAEALVLAAWTG